MLLAKAFMALFHITISVEARASPSARRCHVGSSEDDLTDLVTSPEEDCVCGRVNRADDDNTVGGVRVEENEYPWQVLVKTMFDSSSQLCGGTLLDSLTVLSASHCFYDKTTHESAYGVTITLGEHNRKKPTGKEIYDGVPMTSVILHPGYSISRGDNDISMIFLNSPVSWSNHSNIRPACLPSEEITQEKYVDNFAVATGWGKMHVDAPTGVDVLREVPVLVKNQQTCVDSYRNHRLGQIIDDSLFCAGEPGRDTCQGDSGGPLVVRDTHGQYEVIGVTKAGKGCGDVGFPGLYTSTVHYRDWILQQRAEWVQPEYEEYEYEEEVSSGQEGSGEEVAEATISDEPSTPVFKTSYADNLWTNAVIPYRFEMDERDGPLFSDSDISDITKVMRNVSEIVPCLHFRPVAEDYMGAHIIWTTLGDAQQSAYGCWSYLGMNGPRGGHRGQVLNFGSPWCLNMFVFYHELLHAIGIRGHEINRSDRRAYVKIYKDNIAREGYHQFRVEPDQDPATPYSTEYDFMSITNYGRKVFSRNGADVWTPLNTTGNAYGTEPILFLSLTDIIELGLAYSRVTDKNCFKKELLLEFLAKEKTPPEVTRFLKSQIPDMTEEDSKAIHGGHRACCMRCWWNPQKKRCVSFNMGKTCPC